MNSIESTLLSNLLFIHRNLYANDYKQYRIAIPNMTSDRARTIQALAWKEIIGELAAKIPALQDYIQVNVE